MGAKSRIKKWNFSYLCLFSLTNVFAFPHTNTLEDSQATALGGEIANIHRTLQSACESVPSTHNRFACAFRFKTISERFFTICVNVVFESGCNPIFTLNPTDVYSILKSRVHDPFYLVQQQILEHSRPSSPPTVLLASTYKLIHSRYNHTRSMPNGINQPFFRIENVDSEAKAIACLYREDVINLIATEAKNRLQIGETITDIELHGFTDRDMCALCYTNFNMIIELTCYNPLRLYPTFLTKLKNQLGTRCPSPNYAIYISSPPLPFPPPTNILWNPRLNPPGPCTYARHVNQFRIDQLPANAPIEERYVVTPDINPPAPRSSAARRGRGGPPHHSVRLNP